MAVHALSRNFQSFFGRLNPGTSFVQTASREHETITGLIEDPNGQASVLSPHCFLQGSYKQDTAIHTINDVDIVALCNLSQPGSQGGGRSYNRDEIFGIIAAPLLADRRYRDKIRYDAGSMCIKVDLGIKVEILPVVYKAGTSDQDAEPFRLYRPETHQWEDGYARYHQGWLTNKNANTDGNFIPMIKVLKHLRAIHNISSVSFHIESLLFRLPDSIFAGAPSEYILHVLNYIASYTADAWYNTDIRTPCGDRNIFTPAEWPLESWRSFHAFVKVCADGAKTAATALPKDLAVRTWKILLGDSYFPADVT